MINPFNKRVGDRGGGMGAEVKTERRNKNRVEGGAGEGVESGLLIMHYMFLH